MVQRQRHSDYLVPDLLQAGLKLVFCGTAPSQASARARAYYAKPGNRFWPTLHAVGITPRQFAPHEYRLLLDLGIGLTDLCKVHCGTDAQLPADAFDLDALKGKLARHRPRLLAFTSKNAAKAALGRAVEYGPQALQLEGVDLFVLPSPSGLATRYFDIAVWRALATKVNNPRR